LLAAKLENITHLRKQPLRRASECCLEIAFRAYPPLIRDPKLEFQLPLNLVTKSNDQNMHFEGDSAMEEGGTELDLAVLLSRTDKWLGQFRAKSCWQSNNNIY
jgi:hypothetical protein